MSTLSENQKETIRKDLKEELPAVFSYKREQLEEIARTCDFDVPYASDLRDYCSNVLSEALRGDQVPKLIEEINKVIIKEELVYLYGNQPDRLEEIARTCCFNVPHSPSFGVYCSNVVSEAEKHGEAAKLLQKVLSPSEYPRRDRLQHLLVINRKFETVTKQKDRQKPSAQTRPLDHAEETRALITQTLVKPHKLRKKPDQAEEVPTPITQTTGKQDQPQTLQQSQPPRPAPTKLTSHTPRQKLDAIFKIKKVVGRIVRFQPKRSTLMALLLWLPLILFIIPLILTILYWIDNTNIFLCIIAIVTAVSIVLLCTYNLFFAKAQIAHRRRSLTGFFSSGKWCNIIALVVVITSVALNAFSVINNSLHQGSTTHTIGICDGNCLVDPYRLDRNLKQEAANAFNRNDQNTGCQDLRWAAIGDIQGTERVGQDASFRSIALDSTDAEAKIYYANRCTNIQCPCISYVAVVQMVDPADPQYSNNSDYINGVGRGILQGAYVKQNEWNTSHPQGPGLYIFVANIVASDPTQGDSIQTQDTVVQQIIGMQQSDTTHRILGVIGLPFDSSRLETKLNAVGIPMISTTPMSTDNDKPLLYLFSVVPSLKEEIQDILNYCNQAKFKKILYYYNYQDYYSSKLFNATWTNIINTNQPLSKKINSTPYFSPDEHKGWSLPTQAALSDANLIVFIGPMNDTVRFLTELRQEEKKDGISQHKVLSDDNAYQWVYKYFGPDEHASRVAFDQVYFVSFAYPDPYAITNQPNKPSMLNDFNSLFDPTSKHSGNIYTHQRASSDAILAYDALSVLVTAEDNLSKTAPTNLNGWGNKLQQYISSHNFYGVSGQITYKSGSLPDQKIILLISVTGQKNAIQETLSGKY